MGYELDRLMAHYGVSTPSLTFTGSADNPEDVRKYEDYKRQYGERIAGRSIYDMLYPPPVTVPQPEVPAPQIPTVEPPRRRSAFDFFRKPVETAINIFDPRRGAALGDGVLRPPTYAPAPPPVQSPAPPAVLPVVPTVDSSFSQDARGDSGVAPAAPSPGMTAGQAMGLTALGAGLSNYGSSLVAPGAIAAGLAGNAMMGIGQNALSSLDAAMMGPSVSAAQNDVAQAMADYAESGAAGAGMAGGNDGSMGVGSGSADLMAKGGLAKIKRFQAGGVNREAWMRMAPLEKESEPVEAEPVGISLPSVPVTREGNASFAVAEPMEPFARPSMEELAQDYGVAPESAPVEMLAQPGVEELAAANQMQAPAVAPAAMLAPSVGAPMTGATTLEDIFARYRIGTPEESTYAKELAAARAAAKQETDAFYKMLNRAIAEPSEKPNKAEMYFRLAAAFGTPGKTGSFGEGLAQASASMAEQMKEEKQTRRTERERRLALGLEAQKARMASAKEDVAALRSLTAEEMKDKRTVATELLKDWVKRNDPVSSAGKQAQDEGLKAGTPEYQKRVREISDLAVDRQMAQINATVAGMSAQMANLALAQSREQRAKDEAARLTPAELKLKTETADLIASADSAIGVLREAYKLNPNTFDNSVKDVAQRKVLEAAGSKDPKLLATRQMENLLAEQALEKLKATFGAAPTEGERKILLDLQGIGAKSVEERAAIMRQAFKSLQNARERHQKRLNEIESGLYRNVKPAEGGLD